MAVRLKIKTYCEIQANSQNDGFMRFSLFLNKILVAKGKFEWQLRNGEESEFAQTCARSERSMINKRS